MILPLLSSTHHHVFTFTPVFGASLHLHTSTHTTLLLTLCSAELAIETHNDIAHVVKIVITAYQISLYQLTVIMSVVLSLTSH